MTVNTAPGLLVASPSLNCPFFHHTVVLLVEHDDAGALGFVVNRPGEGTLLDLAENQEMQLDGDARDRAAESPLWVGGPVAPETGWVLFDSSTAELPEIESLELTGGVSVSASRALLRQLIAGKGPSTYCVLLGYAGWGPGQLDDEIRTGSWVPVDLEPGLIFEGAPESRWAAALATLGIDPARMLSSHVADA